MKFNKNILKEKWFAYTAATCSAVVLYLLLTHLGSLAGWFRGLWKVGAPVFMALMIAYVLNPLVTVYSTYVFHKVGQKKLRHTLSVALAVLTVVVFFSILMTALVPQIIESVAMFAGNLNGYSRSLQKLMLRLNTYAASHDIDLSQFITSSDELLQSITKVLPENINKIVNVSYGFGTKVFDWMISLILAVYLLLDNEKLQSGFARLLRALLPAAVYHNTMTFWSRCNRILVRYIAFDLLDGLIIGACNWLFMVLMGMPYVAIISVIVGVTNLAPTFGPMVGAVLGAFILVLVNPLSALWFLIFTAVLQTLDGYIIKPRLFGGQLGVSAVWILISLVLGGRLLGVAGILLAIPFAAICDFIYHDYILSRLEEQKLQNDMAKVREAASKMEAARALKAKTVQAGTAAGVSASKGLPPDMPADGAAEAGILPSESLYAGGASEMQAAAEYPGAGGASGIQAAAEDPGTGGAAKAEAAEADILSAGAEISPAGSLSAGGAAGKTAAADIPAGSAARAGIVTSEILSAGGAAGKTAAADIPAGISPAEEAQA